MWEPRFVCPECRAALLVRRRSDTACSRCGEIFESAGDTFAVLARRRRDAKHGFLHQYRVVREADGYRSGSTRYYRGLPYVARKEPRAEEWRIRRESYERLLREILGGRWGAWRVLDLGAGNGWLSNRLAEGGHAPVAVDVFDDERDGLGACSQYPQRFCVVQADFDALPFEPRQFDLVLFNASLHYAPHPSATLADAHRMLAEDGVMAVIDSPMFTQERDGRMMAAEQAESMRSRHGLPEVARPGQGFVTFGELDRVATSLGLRPSFYASRGPMMWRLKRQIARRRLKRSPAAFGLWVAR